MDLAALADIDVDALPEDELRALLTDLDAAAKAEKFGKFHSYYPDSGPLRRELYPKHLEFFRAGAAYLERLMMAANRTGKSEAGAFESTAHLTGDYPHWWEGRRFNRPVRMWAAGDTNETTRDVVQAKLLGGVEWHGENKGVDGSGMIPRGAIDQDSISWKAGVPDLVDTVMVRHKLGSMSTLGLKSYKQGRRAFQGTEQDIVWVDEEPDEDVYGEMLIRLMTTGGLAMLTFTPLNGHTKVIESFMPQGDR